MSKKKKVRTIDIILVVLQSIAVLSNLFLLKTIIGRRLKQKA